MTDDLGTLRRGVMAGVVISGVAGVAAFVHAPPVPLGEWSVVGRIALSAAVTGMVFTVCWFLTILRLITRGLDR